MRNPIVQAAFLTAALVLISVIPAAAAESELGVGISFLGNYGGTGLIVDYAKPSKTVNANQTLSWVGDFSFFHDSDTDSNNLLLQGGARLSGRAGEKTMWDGQGLIGLRHSSCCSGRFSDSGGVLTIGGGLQYAISDSKAVRGQLDFPIPLGDGDATHRFSVLYVLKLK